jgi:hypothetical protein
MGCHWALGGKVSEAAWMHDSMFDTDFKNLLEGHHLLNFNLNLFLYCSPGGEALQYLLSGYRRLQG